MIPYLWAFYYLLLLSCFVWAIRLWVRVDRLKTENELLRDVVEILRPEPIETVEEVELGIHPDWKVTEIGALLPGQESDPI